MPTEVITKERVEKTILDATIKKVCPQVTWKKLFGNFPVYGWPVV